MEYNVLERFWSKVQKTDSCWLWKGAKNQFGYGFFRLGSRNEVAHRVSYNWIKGEIPSGLLVLHTCDNPSCVNPDHLFIGTHSDNMRDMYRKKRHKGGNPPSCHPSQPYHSKGLCRYCYLKQWKESHPEKVKTYRSQEYQKYCLLHPIRRQYRKKVQ